MSAPDKYELFLTGRMSASRLCDNVGLDPIDVHEVLMGLQNAHDRIVNQEANRMLVGLVKAIRDGKVTAAQAKALFDMDPEALEAISKFLFPESVSNFHTETPRWP